MTEQAITEERKLPLNQIICGEVRQILRTLPDECVDLVITSPPYWGLRDYGKETKTIWSEDEKCQHQWGVVAEKAGTYYRGKRVRLEESGEWRRAGSG